MKNNPLLVLESLGQSVWLDYLSRGAIQSGKLRRLIEEDGVSGVTSNPAIFEKSIVESRDYDKAIEDLALQDKSAEEIYDAITVEDIQMAADLLRPVYERTDGADGFVSLEVSPHLARNTQGTVDEARRLWAAVNRPNLLVKVPGTQEGLPAIQDLIGEHININVTLLFGLPRYRQVTEAYLGGLEALAARGQSLRQATSVASFFLSRIDILADPLLKRIMEAGGPRGEMAGLLRGQIAIASAKMARQIYHEVFEGERFRKLAERGARKQRLLWASTSTKNPADPDTKYVEPLIGPDSINTMPMETVAAYRDHGKPEAQLDNKQAQAQAALNQLAELGINIDSLTQQLVNEGISKFSIPFDLLIETLAKAREAALNRRLAVPV